MLPIPVQPEVPLPEKDDERQGQEALLQADAQLRAAGITELDSGLPPFNLNNCKPGDVYPKLAKAKTQPAQAPVYAELPGYEGATNFRQLWQSAVYLRERHKFWVRHGAIDVQMAWPEEVIYDVNSDELPRLLLLARNVVNALGTRKLSWLRCLAAKRVLPMYPGFRLPDADEVTSDPGAALVMVQDALWGAGYRFHNLIGALDVGVPSHVIDLM